MIDLITHNFDGNRIPEIKCLNAGFVRLVDVMPRVSYDTEITTCDHAVVQAARVSYGDGTKKVSEDKGLIRYLMRHRHTTPFEMIEFKFHCSMPVFVARQWIRHRTANVNEMSGRYSVLPNKFYVPDLENVRQQSTKNKQVSEGQVEDMSAQEFINYIEEHCKKTYEEYEKFKSLFFECPVKRSLKIEYIRENCTQGLLHYLREDNEKATSDDYNYFKNCGEEWVIIGSQEFIDNFEQAINNIYYNGK